MFGSNVIGSYETDQTLEDSDYWKELRRMCTTPFRLWEYTVQIVHP